jgi:hypothetical protein
MLASVHHVNAACRPETARDCDATPELTRGDGDASGDDDARSAAAAIVVFSAGALLHVSRVRRRQWTQRDLQPSSARTVWAVVDGLGAEST